MGNRWDSFQNMITGLGRRGRDKSVSGVSPVVSHELTESQAAALFDGDSLARKAILKPIMAELRSWIDFSGLDSDELIKVTAWMNQRNVRQKFIEARTMEAVFGGSLMVLNINDGLDPAEPLKLGAARDIVSIYVVDRHRVTQFGDHYVINGSLRVNRDRVLRFDGSVTTNWTRNQRSGWGVSDLEIAYQKLADCDLSFHAVSTLIAGFNTTLFKMRGLSEAVAAGQRSFIEERVSLVEYSRSVLNAMVLDAEHESIETLSAQVSGLADLVDRVMLSTAEAVDMPVSLLFGRAPAGLNATGESDLEHWYSRITDAQDFRSRPNIESFCHIMFNLREGPTGGVEPDWEFSFRPIRKKDEHRQAQIQSTQASADVAMIQAGVITPSEVRASRFGSDEYSLRTVLDPMNDDLLKDLEAISGIPDPTSDDS